jgi:Sec-independent protein secretion pathway component TatC
VSAKVWLLLLVGVPVVTYLLTAVRLVARNTWREWRRRGHAGCR